MNRASFEPDRPLSTRCVIAGGGPAGMMLGYLLARAGIDVIVLEKHADFLRDFRGDTVHPSTLEVMAELGLLEKFLERPHRKVSRVAIQIGDERIEFGDLSRLPVRAPYIAFMPQWEFLDFLADEGRELANFRLFMRAEVTGLLREGERIVGLAATIEGVPREIHADLTVAADGRRSILRAAADLRVISLGAPIDVLWFPISRRPGDPEEVFGRVLAGRLMVMLDRGDYWQCAFVIRKGSFDEMQRGDFAAFRTLLAETAPFIAARVGELKGWDDLKLLSVAVDRLERWHLPGFLCIGDAAHAMSPIGGVGINLAIQDAVAASNILTDALRQGVPDEAVLAAVQKRRDFPTRATQAFQVAAQTRLIGPVLESRGALRAPWLLKLFNRFPILRRIPARLVGIGVRPEHVRTRAEPRSA